MPKQVIWKETRRLRTFRRTALSGTNRQKQHFKGGWIQSDSSLSLFLTHSFSFKIMCIYCMYTVGTNEKQRGSWWIILTDAKLCHRHTRCMTGYQSKYKCENVLHFCCWISGYGRVGGGGGVEDGWRVDRTLLDVSDFSPRTWWHLKKFAAGNCCGLRQVIRFPRSRLPTKSQCHSKLL